MHIVELYAENIKRLRAVTIRPDGPMVLITGQNGQGKSSVLDAIYMAVAGKDAIPSQPVRNGEESAIVKLDFGEIIVTRKFTANGGTSLVVAAANGAKFSSPQKMLDEMLGSLTFDPLEFSRMPATKQLEALRGLVKLEVDIDALDLETQALYEQRTVVNRDAKSLASRIDASPAIPEGTPSEPVDVASLMKELDAAAKHNTSLTMAQIDMRRRASLIDEKREAIRKLHEEVNALENALWDLQAKYKNIVATDTVPLVRAIEESQTVNTNVLRHRQWENLMAEYKDHEQRATELSSKITANAVTRATAITSAEYPVDGLTFGDGEILFNNIPFSQASTAEQLKVSIAIAMAGNPKLKVIRIKEGSLLDTASLKMVEFMADMHGFQVWVEKVDESGVGIVIEDGSIKCM